MDRIPRTATVVISAVTALAWLLALLAGPAFNAPYFLGFIPARFSGLVMIWSTCTSRSASMRPI